MPKTYKVVFTTSAFKEYKKLSKKIKLRVDETLDLLSMHPLAEVLKFKKIKGKENHYRIRVGDYRIVYSPISDVLIIHVLRVGHRKDVYRHF